MPNPSGRSTPPHKRSPRKKGKGQKAKSRFDVADSGAVVSGWTEEGRNVVPKLIVGKWAEGKEQIGEEGQIAGSSSTATTRPQTSAQTPVETLAKGGSEEQIVVTSRMASTGESSSTQTTTPGPSSSLIVKTLPNGKKQVLEQPVTKAESSSSVVYDPHPPGCKKTKFHSASKPTQRPKSAQGHRTTKPGDRYHALATQDPRTVTLEKDIDQLIADAAAKGWSRKSQNGQNAKIENTRHGSVGQLPSRAMVEKKQIPVKAEALGKRILPRSHSVEAIKVSEKKAQITAKVEDSSAVSSCSSTKQLESKILPVGGYSGAVKMLVEKWAKGKQQATGKDQVLDSKEGSAWLADDPQLPPVEAEVNDLSRVCSTNLDYAKAASGSGGNGDPGSSAPIKTSVAPVSVQIRSPGQHMISEGLSVTSKMPDCTKFASGSGKTDALGTLTQTKGLAPVCAPMPFVSPPHYATAAAGGDGKDMDKLALDRTPTTSPTKASLTVPVVLTKEVIAPTKLTSSLIAPTLEKCSASAQASPSSPNSRKSWSSVVTGNTNDSGLTPKSPQKYIAITEGFPELGKPSGMFPSNKVPALPKRNSSLSAMAKPFEPAALRHATSADSYLRPETPVIPHQEPIPQQYPTPATPAPAEKMNFPFDSLLEIFYSTPQFTEYLNRSYNELLFKENYLRAQYARIAVVFEDEWNYVAASHRKAVVAKALSNLSEVEDRIQFSRGKGVQDMLYELGLTKSLPATPVVPILRRSTNSNLRDAYISGASAKGKEKEDSSGARSTDVAYLKWRAEYCFDLDPEALSTSPDWLYGIIGWILGKSPPLRHRFGPGQDYNSSSFSDSSDQGIDGTFGQHNLWCSDDCEECEEAERTGYPTEYTFVGMEGNGSTDKGSRASTGPSSPMLERFLDEIEIPEGYIPDGAFPNPYHSQKPFSGGRSPFAFSQPSILEMPRLMSNRFTDLIFQQRSDEWTAANPGRANFMELMNIDIALFYCELIEQILQIFGEVRRERVWFKLPTLLDYFDGIPRSSDPQERGRPITRPAGLPGSGHVRSTIMKEYEEKLRMRNWRAGVHRCVLDERTKVWAFLKETQRTADWLVAGVTLVERDTNRVVGKAYDGGLWTVPVPPSEKERLGKGFDKWCMKRV